MTSSLTPTTSVTLNSDTAARIALAVAGFSGNGQVAHAINAAGGAAQLVAIVHDRTGADLPLSDLIRQQIRAGATGESVARVLAATCALGLSVITPLHEQWPTRLASLGRAVPMVLWVRGDPDVLEQSSVAVTGMSAPTAYGINMSAELGTGLSERGWAIGSSVSSGIDRLALNAAVAVGGKAVAVSCASIDRVTVDEQVTVISEVPPTVMLSTRSQLRARLLLAAITTKLVLVEAPLTSGAVRTAEAAHAIGRPVGVVPGPASNPSSPFSSGCQQLAQRHGVAVVTSVDDAHWLR